MSSPYLDLLLGGPLPPGEVTLLFDPSPELSLLVESPSILSIFSSFRARLAFSEGAPAKKYYFLELPPFSYNFLHDFNWICLEWLLMPKFLLFFTHTWHLSEKKIFPPPSPLHTPPPKKKLLTSIQTARNKTYHQGSWVLYFLTCCDGSPKKFDHIKVFKTLQKVWQKLNGGF